MEWTAVLAVVVGLTFPVLGLAKAYVKWTTAMCKCTCRMDGRTVIITGANTGIGRETALELARRGARVILACRNMKKANDARDDIVSRTGNEFVVVRELDLASLASVRRFARDVMEEEDRLDVLINNAGATRLGETRTSDGLNEGMQVNHFGPFLLTVLLLDLLKKSSPSRIVFVSSAMHKFANFDVENLNFEKWFVERQVYRYSKLANIITSNELARRLHGVTANSLHPGIVRTEIWSNKPPLALFFYQLMLRIVGKSAVEGAQTTIHLAVSDQVEGVTGKYFVDCKESNTSLSRLARDLELAREVWRRSEQYTQLCP